MKKLLPNEYRNIKEKRYFNPMEFKSDFLSAVEFIEALRYFSRKGLLTFLFNPLVPTSGGLWGATFPYQAKLFLQSGARFVNLKKLQSWPCTKIPSNNK